MSNKYDSFRHIEVLSELNVLFSLVNETQVKINALKVYLFFQLPLKDLARLNECMQQPKVFSAEDILAKILFL